MSLTKLGSPDVDSWRELKCEYIGDTKDNFIEEVNLRKDK